MIRVYQKGVPIQGILFKTSTEALQMILRREMLSMRPSMTVQELISKGYELRWQEKTPGAETPGA